MKLHCIELLNDCNVGRPIVFQHQHVTGRLTVIDEQHVQNYFIKVLVS